MTSSTRAGSWTSGPARRGCSSTASGTGTNFSSLQGRERAAGGRRQVVGADVVPEDRRPGGGGDQVRRDDAARGEDGDLRHGSPRISKNSSTGRLSKSKRSPASSPAPGSNRRGSTTSSQRSARGTAPKPMPSTRRSNPGLKAAIRSAKKAMVPETYVQRVLRNGGQGFASIEFRTYDTDWDGEAYLSRLSARTRTTRCA